MDLRDRIAGKLRNLVAPPLERGSRQAVVLAVASSKGGVGKTTTAINLAVGYTRRGKNVLLVDLDPQAHVAAALNHPGSGDGSLSDVLLGRLREVCEVATPSRWSGLDLAGSDKELAATESVLSTRIGKELILEGALPITRSRYDLIVLDCPPNLGTLTLNALCAAHHLLVPCDMSVLALEGVSDILAAVATLRDRLQRRLALAGIVITRYDKRATQMNEAIDKSFVELYAGDLLGTRIPQSAALNKAHLAGESVFDYDARSPGAKGYAALVDELAPRLGVSLAQATVSAGARRGRAKPADRGAT